MSSINILNPRADVLRKSVAFAANCHAAKGLQQVLKANLGPKGTLKMLVGGGGQIKVTKDGCVLLSEMQIQHPTASMIARACTAQDDISGDGTTSIVIIIGEILRQAEHYVYESIHPRLICEGLDIARKIALDILEEIKVPIDVNDRETLLSVAQTSLRTKLVPAIADNLADIVCDSLILLRQNIEDDSPVDLHMVEVLPMKQGTVATARLVRGMVMDHGSRHPDMPKKLNNCYILTLNVSLEYEKSEVNSSFFYSTAEQRDKLVEAERSFTDEKVKKIIELKRLVCNNSNNHSFVVLNQKGIDPPSLDMLAKENIIALRRVKRRNMERLTLCCGGNAMNSVEDLQPEDLGWADTVYEQVLGEEKFTFVEGVKNCKSCCILISGPNDHSIAQIKDAIRDGLRAVKNAVEDKCVIPGGGAFEIAVNSKLQEEKKKINSKVRFGLDCLADAMLSIPKTLAENAGLDSQDLLIKLTNSYESNKKAVGADLITGEPMNPVPLGIWDNYRVKRQMLSIAPTLAQQLLLVDEIIRAGKQMRHE